MPLLKISFPNLGVVPFQNVKMPSLLNALYKQSSDPEYNVLPCKLWIRALTVSSGIVAYIVRTPTDTPIENVSTDDNGNVGSSLYDCIKDLILLYNPDHID